MGQGKGHDGMDCGLRKVVVWSPIPKWELEAQSDSSAGEVVTRNQALQEPIADRAPGSGTLTGLVMILPPKTNNLDQCLVDALNNLFWNPCIDLRATARICGNRMWSPCW